MEEEENLREGGREGRKAGKQKRTEKGKYETGRKKAN